MRREEEAILATVGEVATICDVNDMRGRKLLAEDIIPSIFTGNGIRKRYYTTKTFIDYTKKLILNEANGELGDNPSNKEIFLSSYATSGIHKTSQKEAEVITFSNLKGGVGKTTNTINIAIALAKLGQRVLIVDMDAQAQSSRYFKKVLYKGNSILSLFENIMDRERAPLDKEAINSRIVKIEDTGVENVSVSILPSEIALTKKLEAAKMTMIRPEKMLLDILNKIKDDYDFILIDTPPYPGLSLQLSFYAADKIVLVTEAEEFSIEGLESTIEEIIDIQHHTEKYFKIDTIFVSSYKQLKHQEASMNTIIDICMEKLDGDVSFQVIKDSSSIGTAQILQLPIIGYTKKPRNALSLSVPFFNYAQKLILTRNKGE